MLEQMSARYTGRSGAGAATPSDVHGSGMRRRDDPPPPSRPLYEPTGESFGDGWSSYRCIPTVEPLTFALSTTVSLLAGVPVFILY